MTRGVKDTIVSLAGATSLQTKQPNCAAKQKKLQQLCNRCCTTLSLASRSLRTSNVGMMRPRHARPKAIFQRDLDA